MKLTAAKKFIIGAFGLCAQQAMAQSFSIDWHSTDSGGTSSGGTFTLSGTVGQPDANPQPMEGGGFSLTGGFWSIFEVEAPGAPTLNIESLGSDIRVFWPLSTTDFVLDVGRTVTGTWSQVSFPYTTNTADISVIAPSPTGYRFYRLRKP